MLRQLSPLDFFPLAPTSEFGYAGHAAHPIYYIYTKTTFNLCKKMFWNFSIIPEDFLNEGTL